MVTRPDGVLLATLSDDPQLGADLDALVQDALSSPPAVVLVTRTRFVPAVRLTVTDVAAHVSQFAVLVNAGVAATIPLTLTAPGRLALVPLA